MGIKIALGAVWVYAALCLFLPLPLAAVGQTVFWVMLVVHVVEFIVMQSTFRKAGGSLGHHFAQTLLFGMFHLRTVRARADEEPAS